MMAFYLYELCGEGGADKQFILIRVKKRFASSANNVDEVLAEFEMELKQYSLLFKVLENTGHTKFELIGFCETSPEGDELYEEKGGFELSFWFADTDYGKPFILISQAETAEEFCAIIESDEDMISMKPMYQSCQKIKAVLHTENDLMLDNLTNGKAFEEKAINMMEALRGSDKIKMIYRFISVLIEHGWIFENVNKIKNLINKITLRNESFGKTYFEELNFNELCLNARYEKKDSEHLVFETEYKPSHGDFSINILKKDSEETKSFKILLRVGNPEQMNKILESINKNKGYVEYDNNRRFFGYDGIIEEMAQQGIQALVI